MPSRTIRPTEAPAPAPFAYTIGAADGLAPEAVFAQWDGSGAFGDFLPCVSYYSAEGILLDRAFPTTGAVTAGDTAEVSYRPFERGGSASTPPPPVFVPAVARAHVTSGSFLVTANSAQVPFQTDFAQNVTPALNKWTIDVSGWYLLHGEGGLLRIGPGGARDRIGWFMQPSSVGTDGQAIATVETALLAGQFVIETMAVSLPLFLPAGEDVQVFASVVDQFGAVSLLGTLRIFGFFGLYQLA